MNQRRNCRKVRFRDHLEAITALHTISNARARAHEHGVATRRREVRCYECANCRGFHLTSQVA